MSAPSVHQISKEWNGFHLVSFLHIGRVPLLMTFKLNCTCPCMSGDYIFWASNLFSMCPSTHVYITEIENRLVG